MKGEIIFLIHIIQKNCYFFSLIMNINEVHEVQSLLATPSIGRNNVLSNPYLN
jgi:hypothetical protein